MYLRSKKVQKKDSEGNPIGKAHTYYYLVEYEQVEGKIKQKVVAYLGNAEKVKEMYDCYRRHKSL